MGIFDVEVRIVGGEDHVVFKAVFGDVLGRDFIAFHRAVALALKVFQRRQGEIRILCLARGLSVFSHTPQEPGSPRAVSFQKSHFQLGKAFHHAAKDHIAAGEHVRERKT